MFTKVISELVSFLISYSLSRISIFFSSFLKEKTTEINFENIATQNLDRNNAECVKNILLTFGTISEKIELKAGRFKINTFDEMDNIEDDEYKSNYFDTSNKNKIKKIINEKKKMCKNFFQEKLTTQWNLRRQQRRLGHGVFTSLFDNNSTTTVLNRQK